MKKKKYMIQYEGFDSHIVECLNEYTMEDGVSLKKAQKELETYFLEQRRGYQATASYYTVAYAKLKRKILK